MSNFTFVTGEECDVCGHDHKEWDEDIHVFRKLGGGRDDLIGVRSIAHHKWYDLYEKVGDDWKLYQYVGTKEHVNSMLTSGAWDSVDDLPWLTMAMDAPADVGEN